jgi:hypothetical protein
LKGQHLSFASPIHLKDNAATVLRRINLQPSNGAGGFDEDWLQDVLFNHCHAIPFRDIDPTLGTVVPLCREMSTPAGPVDLVCVTTSGKVVLVETKLFRNPEARRTVVGQILDYAKELTSWRFEQLAARVASASGKGHDYLMSAVKAQEAGLDEARFVDSVNRSLSRADMTLLIVGDGIPTGAEALVGFLERHGGLQFSLGLVEVAVFETPDGGRLIQPRVLAKTELLRRTLLLTTEGASIQEVSPESAAEDVEPTWQQVFWTELLSNLHLDDITQPVPPKPPRGTNAYFPTPPNGNFSWISAFIASSRHQVGVYQLLSASNESAASIFASLQSQKDEIEREIGAPLSWETTAKSFLIIVRRTYSSLENIEERQRVKVFLREMINKFVNSFRPRLAALQRDRTLDA